MRLRTKLFAAAGSLALVGSFAMMGVNNASATAIPGQNVAQDHVTCDTLVGTIKFGTALKLGGNPNVTTNPITIKGTIDGCTDPDNLNVGIAPSTISGVLTSTFTQGQKCAADGSPTDPPGIGNQPCHGRWFGDSVFIKAKQHGSTTIDGIGGGNVTCVVGRKITGGDTQAGTTISACNAASITLSLATTDTPVAKPPVTVFTMEGPDHPAGNTGSFGVNDCFGLSGKTTGVSGDTVVTWKNAKNTGKLYQDAGLTIPAVTHMGVTQTSGGEFNVINDAAHAPIPAYNGASTYGPGDYVVVGGDKVYSTLTTTATFVGNTHAPGGLTNDYWAYQGPVANSNSYGGTYGLFQIGQDALHGQTSAATVTGAFLGGDAGATGTFDGATGQSEAALATACLGTGIKSINFGIGGVHFG